MLSTLDKIRALPPELQAEVAAFVDFLWEKRGDNLSSDRLRPSSRIPTFTWAGALADMAGRHTSVALQHQISNWRIEDE